MNRSPHQTTVGRPLLPARTCPTVHDAPPPSQYDEFPCSLTATKIPNSVEYANEACPMPSAFELCSQLVPSGLRRNWPSASELPIAANMESSEIHTIPLMYFA